ncbi:MAG: AgmX/PglI C-terminal domain-containing protein [Pseudomonadota bacterium]|nr:AgmX/PglI C-terminal domain-containing protein [Pseudomonadota bacterium]
MADRGLSPVAQGLLPWSREAGENRRFAVILSVMLVLFLPPAFLIPSLELPERDRSEVEQIPPRLARLVEAPRPVTPPEPVQPEPDPEPEPEPEPVRPPEPAKPEPQVAESKPQPVQEPAPEATRPADKPVQTAEQAREKASRSGLLAMKDRLASMRAPEPAPEKTFTANIGNDPTKAEPAPEQSAVLAGSGGVADQAMADTSVAVADHEVKSVEVAKEAAPQEVAASPRAAKPSTGERAMSNIRKVFDAQKTALYSLYRRELRQDPTLEGKVLLELVIEPDGSVSACEVVSSELEHPTLEQRIAMRVRLFNFGADNVEARRVRFPIDFLPG